MLDPVIAETLGAGARVFCLVASPDTIMARVAERTCPPTVGRPRSAGPHRLDCSPRAPLDTRAFEQVSTDDLTAADVAHDLLHRLR